MSLGPYDKLKNVWIVILKVLKCVRTHPEELLVQKFDFPGFLSTKGQEMRVYHHKTKLKNVGIVISK